MLDQYICSSAGQRGMAFGSLVKLMVCSRQKSVTICVKMTSSGKPAKMDDSVHGGWIFDLKNGCRNSTSGSVMDHCHLLTGMILQVKTKRDGWLNRIPTIHFFGCLVSGRVYMFSKCILYFPLASWKKHNLKPYPSECIMANVCKTSTIDYTVHGNP